MKKSRFIFICSFFFALGGNILGFSIIYRLSDWFSFSSGQIGAFIALGQIAFFLGCNIYYRIGSYFDPARVFSVSVIVVLLASIPLVLIRIEAVVYVSFWVLQLGTGCFWPPVSAWLVEGLDSKNVNREMSFFSRSWMSANMVAPLIGGALYRINSVINSFVLVCSYSIAVLFFFLMYRKKVLFLSSQPPLSTGHGLSSDPGTAPLAASAPSLQSRTIDIKLNIYRYRGWLSGFCSAILVGLLVSIVPLHIRDGLGFTEWSAGLLLFIRCVAGLIGFSILARFTSWHFNKYWFMIIQAGLILVSILYIMAGDRFLFFAFIVIIYGLLNSACYNNSMFYSGTTGKDPKKNMAIHEICLCTGHAIGSAGGGFLYQNFGFSGTSFVFAIVMGLGMAAFVLLGRRAAD